MQVMNTAEFEQKEVLLGQQGKTESFGVSNDAALMSMLSTGLYANPLRTMIQEIIFNAWDAHRMGNCQDTTPIDIYLNDTTGLIVRDYGPGINPDDMVPIYCIYGNSTKRDDKGSTGGFGLGSKSPFAYTESFTVTSYHDNKQNMYLISRANDDNDGKPGLTEILKDVPSDQTGLLVTVPIKNDRDLNLAKDYLKELLLYSGIWCNFHYKDEDPVEIHHTAIPAHQWELEEDGHAMNNLYAMYGGVRYKIEDRDEYTVEYRFLKKLIQACDADLRIGFAPDTLTPLPNREGLNFSERTIETIKSQLETMVEFYKSHIKPALRTSLDLAMVQMAGTGVRPEFLAYTWRDIGQYSIKQKVPGSTTYVFRDDEVPPGIPTTQWRSIASLCWNHTETAKDFIGIEEFCKMRAIVFVKQFPEHRKLYNYLADGAGRPTHEFHPVVDLYTPKVIEKLNKDVKAVGTQVGQNLKIRLKSSHKENWFMVDGWRGKKPTRNVYNSRREDKIKSLLGKGLLKTPKVELHDTWFSPEGDKIKDVLLLPSHIVIAKTATALKDTEFKLAMAQAVCPNCPVAGRWDTYHWTQLTGHQSIRPIAGVVIHKKKGQYDQAKALFEDMGYTVLEADEPEVKERPVNTTTDLITDIPPVKKGKPTFAVFRPGGQDWIDYGAPEIEKPKWFFYNTITQINGYDWDHRYARPDSGIRKIISDYFPNCAVIHNKARVPVVERAGARHVSLGIAEKVEKILANEQRVRTMVLHDYVHSNSHLPREILKIPEMQKMFGIPYIRTAQKEAFERDMYILKLFKDSDWNELDGELQRKVKETLKGDSSDPAFAVAHRMCSNTHIFDERELRGLVQGKKPGEIKMLMQKLARLLRTI